MNNLEISILLNFIFLIIISILIYDKKKYIKLIKNLGKNISNKADKNYVDLSLQKWSEPITEKITKNAQNIITLNNNHKKLRDTIDEKLDLLNKNNLSDTNNIEETNLKYTDNIDAYTSVEPIKQIFNENKMDIVLNDYNNMTYRDFIDKYYNYKILIISNFEEIKSNNVIPPNFIETDLGECVAIPIENDIYAIFIKKGLELKDIAFQASGISFIYELSEEPLTGFSYNTWKIKKLPKFQKITNKWICLEKGFLELREKVNPKEVISTKEEELISEEDEKFQIEHTDLYFVSKTSKDYTNLGDKDYSKGNYSSAIKHYKNAINSDYRNAKAYLKLSESYEKTKKYKLSMATYNKLIELYPDEYSYYIKLGDLYYKREEYSSAIDIYKKAINLKPKEEEAYKSLVKYYEIKKYYNSAIDIYEILIGIDNTNYSYYEAIGDLYENQKRHSSALEYYNKALNLTNNKTSNSSIKEKIKKLRR